MRTKEEINADYTHCAAVVGDLMYRAGCCFTEIEKIKIRMKELNEEIQKHDPQPIPISDSAKITTPKNTHVRNSSEH